MDEVQRAIQVLGAAPLREVQRRGWHFQKCNYYSACNDLAFLDANRDLWTGRDLPGEIDWNIEGQRAAAAEAGAFADELRDIPEHADAQPGGGQEGPLSFHWVNGMWNNADAMAQYGLLRSRKPARVIEIGCGWSSVMMARALRRNEGEGAGAAEVTLIEPYPRDAVLRAVPVTWRLEPVMLQRADLAWFDALGPGDVLFYDGSHVTRAASDVNWFFFRVLPRVKPGVLIHIHDIFFPADYPEHWIFERGQTWNEQYLLQAFLMHNRAYEVTLCNSMMGMLHRAHVEACYKGVRPPIGSSFWMTKRGGPTSAP
ncbi:MAG: class I SAM-dependent methyltransferase [Phycisphaerales bacterium]|nr:class I SAM-dependent methyltransferase [Phycisphaerales bacterium]